MLYVGADDNYGEVATLKKHSGHCRCLRFHGDGGYNQFIFNQTASPSLSETFKVS